MSVLKDSVQTLFVRAANVLIAAGLGILTARLLGPEGRGIYLLPVLNATLASSIFGGLGSATSYYMLNAGAGKNVLRPAFAAAAIFTTAGILCVLLLAAWQHRPWTALPASICLPPLAVTAIAGGYCFGRHRVQHANLLMVFGSASGFAMMALGLMVIAPVPPVAVAMWIASTVLGSAAAAAYMIRCGTPDAASGSVEFRPYFRFALQSGITNVFTMLNLRIDVYIIAALMPAAALGVYTVAVSGAEALKILTLVVSQTAAPRIGSLAITESSWFTARCIRNNVLASIGPCLFIAGAAPWLLNALYGAHFAGGAEALRILTIGVFASAPASVLSTYYTLKLGRPMVSFWNNALSAAVCCILSVLLIPSLGMAGAALGSTAGYLASAAILVWTFVRRTSLPLSRVLIAQREDWMFLRERLTDRRTI